MKASYHLFSRVLMLLVGVALSTAVYAKYDRQCLDDCFSTGHECKYCAWQCLISDEPAPVWHDSTTPCPLQGYESE